MAGVFELCHDRKHRMIEAKDCAPGFLQARDVRSRTGGPAKGLVRLVA